MISLLDFFARSVDLLRLELSTDTILYWFTRESSTNPYQTCFSRGTFTTYRYLQSPWLDPLNSINWQDLSSYIDVSALPTLEKSGLSLSQYLMTYFMPTMLKLSTGNSGYSHSRGITSGYEELSTGGRNYFLYLIPELSYMIEGATSVRNSINITQQQYELIRSHLLYVNEPDAASTQLITYLPGGLASVYQSTQAAALYCRAPYATSITWTRRSAYLNGQAFKKYNYTGRVFTSLSRNYGILEIYPKDEPDIPLPALLPHPYLATDDIDNNARLHNFYADYFDCIEATSVSAYLNAAMIVDVEVFKAFCPEVAPYILPQASEVYLSNPSVPYETLCDVAGISSDVALKNAHIYVFAFPVSSSVTISSVDVDVGFDGDPKLINSQDSTVVMVTNDPDVLRATALECINSGSALRNTSYRAKYMSQYAEATLNGYPLFDFSHNQVMQLAAIA